MVARYASDVAVEDGGRSRGSLAVTGARMADGMSLEWSAWVPWTEISSGKIQAPARPGVYEVKHRDQEIRLHIGESNKLQRRVSFCLQGAGPHSACERIRANEHVANLHVRWAVTEQHQEAEWQLLEAHEERFGRLPVYTRMKGRWSPRR